ncbi:O-antigen ligase family protein [Salinicoccus roseus]|uniref:O-antigen ligase family protein n=1 Tax=Salinicoccus roseus TaxID=45670 RepID=UPI0022FFDD7C|nr:O-antigen ligase family protein [Salinicoccus roseus]
MAGISIKDIKPTYEGSIFTMIFALLFIVTNLYMIDYKSMQSLIESQDPFMILILFAILVFLSKNSVIDLNKYRVSFLVLWGLYVATITLSMLMKDHFVWSEMLIWLMLTAVLMYRVPSRLVTYLIIAALFSLPALLMIDHTLNESGATLVFVFTAGLLLMPKKNAYMLFYMLPAFIMLNIITTSRTAMAAFIAVVLIQLAWINLSGASRTQKKWFAGVVGGLVAITLVVFFHPIYEFFIGHYAINKGFTLNTFTSGRYVLWETIWAKKEWFGQGHGYFDFTELLHAHNIFFDTLGRYGILAALLFVLVLGAACVIALARRNFGILLYFAIFIFIGLFEYNYLFMFVYFSPIVLLFVLMAYLLTFREDMSDVRATESGK